MLKKLVKFFFKDLGQFPIELVFFEMVFFHLPESPYLVPATTLNKDLLKLEKWPFLSVVLNTGDSGS